MRTYKSTAVRALEELLTAEADPTKKAELATRLSRAQEAVGRERGRRLRARRATPEPAPQPAVDDSNEAFELYTPEELAAQARVDEETARRRAEQRAAEAAKAKVEQEVIAAKEREAAPRMKAPAPRATSFSRTLNSWEAPVWYDYKNNQWLGTTGPDGQVAPASQPDWSIESPELYQQLEANGSLTFSGGEFQNDAANERAEQENNPRAGESFHDHAKRLHGSVGRYE
jgi:hypothetical protein